MSIMGQSRLDLHTLLLTLGTENVYFQPPADHRMVYPCIRYKRDDVDVVFADNKPYRNTTRYLVTVIDPNPDSDIPASIAALPLCAMQRAYQANNLNHDVFVLYF